MDSPAGRRPDDLAHRHRRFREDGALGVFSLGYDDLSDALTHGMAWRLAALLLVGKFAATIVSYGLGGCGGIFSPNLFFGAMCGICVGGIGSLVLPLTPADRVLLAVGGMSACLGAVVQAPVTAILIIFEMTHQFALVPGLMLAGLVSQMIARSMNRANFYEAGAASGRPSIGTHHPAARFAELAESPHFRHCPLRAGGDRGSLGETL